MGMPGTFSQTDYAFYGEGSESGSTIIGTQNNQQNVDVDTNFQIRVLMQESSGTGDVFEAGQWQYELNTSGTWVDVTTTSSVLQAVNSSSLTATDTTSRLTGGTGTFITPNSYVEEGSGPYSDLTWAASAYCEALLSATIVGADVSNGDQILVRLDGTPGPTWTEADINVVKASTGRRRSNVA